MSDNRPTAQQAAGHLPADVYRRCLDEGADPRQVVIIQPPAPAYGRIALTALAVSGAVAGGSWALVLAVVELLHAAEAAADFAQSAIPSALGGGSLIGITLKLGGKK